MAKFSRRRFYKGSKDKYSVEQHSFQQATAASGDLAVEVVPANALQGMRKVKHLTVSLTAPNTGSSVGNINALYWALVYVPQGTSVNPLNIGGPSLYEPNQFVLNSGIVDPDAGPIRISTPLSRNLNSGDSIWLVLGSTAANTSINGMVQYAITLQ